ncbi:hypothetical protein QQS45_10995 [Alteriqipengyuania flavescens]|uniref:hypothetical protein n=1 Tax=Alteriqipengyuania flavescens TaxID=3053610 RepID=UPI0025B3EE26|nr:hypothetical protein [Alteriqipengyuania flavescens]WJY18143.1 hypothetical protein QQW98_10990 [Alteriqipengyuania flavescens]WJY24084.1 hypothetical protein QQS45_10995 [Alteriqipengyuania flavescens]
MSFYRAVAGKAGMILVRIALILFVATFVLGVLTMRDTAAMSTQFGGESGLAPQSLIVTLVQALNSAVWPLVGAGIIFALEARSGGSTFE